MENKFQRGSVWRKWDLHVHTPETQLNNQYSSTDKKDVWVLFCEKIEKSDVDVFGITDYFSIDNYFTFIDKFKKKYPKSKKAFFPNVEFRTESKNSKNEHIQIHVIFSNNQQTLDKIDDFFTRLELVSTNDEYLTNKYCTKPNLNEVGYDKAMVKIDVLEKKLKSDFSEDDYLIVGVANGYGSLRPNGGNDGRGSEYAKELDKKCNLFFGNSKNTNFYLNKVEGRSQFSLPPKPVVFGCDAHSFETLDTKLGKSFEGKDYSQTTWIKADPTFEGLKQIVYEPEERVKIQELKPEEKNDYEIIDKVKFIDGSFTPNEIFINQNLTAIIGGKSTGKSILLRNIAQTIDSDEVSKRLREIGLSDYENKVSDFKVNWRDEQLNIKNENTEVSKKVIYIPQSYLNRLVDKKESRTSIEDIIKNVLAQEDEVNNAFISLQDKNREIEQAITQKIENLLYKRSDIKNLSESIKKIGDKKGIKTEVEKLKNEVSELKKKSNITEEELLQYEHLTSERKDLKNKKESYLRDLKTLEKIKGQEIFTSPFLDDLSEEVQKALKNDLSSIMKKYKLEWINKLDENIDKIRKSSSENDKEIKENEKKLKPLIIKVTEAKSLNEKLKKLEDENKKLKDINNKERNLESLKNDYIDLIDDIVKYHSKFFDNFSEAKTKILEQKIITKEQNLEFDIEIFFKENTFKENFIEKFFNLKKIRNFEKVSLQDYNYSDISKFKEEVKEIINGILDEEIILKGSNNEKDAITKLNECWFAFNYKIKQNGDEISEMSPGKKSLVLLKLLIELDNSKCPILLDQPEDDLDNRSIYNDLVKFIKTKKKERQIIIVTHNANLVVGADAECVIVANQDGGDNSNNREYKFEYVQGALENTFLNEISKYILEQRGIQEHVCDILEGGKIAFEQRKKKYNF
jgi:hypothetical protein